MGPLLGVPKTPSVTRAMVLTTAEGRLPRPVLLLLPEREVRGSVAFVVNGGPLVMVALVPERKKGVLMGPLERARA